MIFWEAHILTLIKNTKEGPKSRDGDSVRISQYNNIFEKGSAPNWSEEVLVIKKVQNTVLWTEFISDLNDEEILQTFYERGLQKK